MQLNNLKPKTLRSGKKRVGRGGKRGTFSGGGTKGQKGRAGSSVKPGFRGGDNRIWQLFPKLRGATHKPGNNRPHRKHRFYQVRQSKPAILSVESLNIFTDGSVVTPEALVEKGLLMEGFSAKILGDGQLNRKITLENIPASKSAQEKIAKAGGSV